MAPLPKDFPPGIMRWDWYQATIPTTYETLDFPWRNAMQVMDVFSVLGPGEDERPVNGYSHAKKFGDTVVYYGGKPGEYGAHVIVRGGPDCHDTVEKIFRPSFPQHNPSRIDVSIDFDGVGLWEKLIASATDLCRKKRIQTETVGDWIDGKRGRTLYLGSRKSTHRVRIYEKGHERRAAKKGKIPNASLDWVRVEFQVKPPTKLRHLVATMTSEQVAMSTDWTSELCSLVGCRFEESLKLNKLFPIPDVSRALNACFGQYAATFRRATRDGYYTKSQLMYAVNKVCEKGVWKSEWLKSSDHDDVPF